MTAENVAFLVIEYVLLCSEGMFENQFRSSFRMGFLDRRFHQALAEVRHLSQSEVKEVLKGMDRS